MDIKTIFIKVKDSFKGKKSFEFIVSFLIIAVIISIYISTITKPTQSKNNDYMDGHENISQAQFKDDEITDRQEIKLQKKLSAIKGAGKVEVMITYKSGKEIVTALNNIHSSTTTEELDSNGGQRKITQNDVNTQAVTMNASDGSKPLIIKEVEPEIKGVIVIAEGAEDIAVRIELLKAVQIALGIHPNQVEVFIMER